MQLLSYCGGGKVTQEMLDRKKGGWFLDKIRNQYLTYELLDGRCKDLLSMSTVLAQQMFTGIAEYFCLR